MGVIGRLHNEECLIYIFTGEVQSGIPNTLTNKNYDTWFQQLRDQFPPVLVNTTYENVQFLNQVSGKILRCGRIDPKTLNKHDLFYQCYIDPPILLFGNLRMKGKRGKTTPPVKTSTII